MNEQGTAPARGDWRDRILSDPAMILEDRDLMRALVAEDAKAQGGNVVDLRGMAMDRLEARLARLEDTHRTVIAAAYENLAGTNQVHRCVLGLLGCEGFGAVLDYLTGEMSDILRVDRTRLVLESAEPADPPHLAVAIVPAGTVKGALAPDAMAPERRVMLRGCDPADAAVYREAAARIRSEALLRLDLGPGRLGAMLAFGSEDPHRFRPGQGTELTEFLAAVVETVLRRLLD